MSCTLDSATDFDVIVIGAGPGGYVSAIKCAQLGLSCAIFEERDVGGTCLNRGCIPTKSLLHSAEVYTQSKNAGIFGVHAEPSFDWNEITARRDDVVTKLRGGIESLLGANKVTVIRARATVAGSGKVVAGDKTYTCKNIIVAAGSVPARPPIPGLTLEGVVTSDEMLEGGAPLPKSLVIIGGGVIGVEFASVYSALGCDVTVIEALDRVISVLDREISQNLTMILKKRGVKILCSSMVKEIVNDGDALCVRYTQKDKEAQVCAEKVLVAIGRRPNSAKLFCEDSMPTFDRARVVVDDNLQTSIPGVYAIGDISSKIQLAHAAEAQGIVAAELIAGKLPSIDLSCVPSCIYTSPEIASVGITADEAKEKGIEVKSGKYLVLGNGKTLIANGERGFVKVIADASSGVVLGAQLMCERATDMISELTTAVVNKLTLSELLSVIRPHPTFNESLTEALELTAEGVSIHSAPPRR